MKKNRLPYSHRYSAAQDDGGSPVLLIYLTDVHPVSFDRVNLNKLHVDLRVLYVHLPFRLVMLRRTLELLELYRFDIVLVGKFFKLQRVAKEKGVEIFNKKFMVFLMNLPAKTLRGLLSVQHF